MRNDKLQNRFQCLLLICLLAAIGCEQPTSIEGTVTLNGEPVKKGSIAFRSPDGKAVSFGSMVKDGKYSVPAAVPGTRVAVIAAVNEGDAVSSRAEAMQATEDAPADRAQAESFLVDLIPQDAEGNSKTVEIVEGPQTLDFAVSTK